MSPYLLSWSSEINHKVPSKEPFDIVITQEALNDIINRADWPIESEGILIYAPTAQIDPNIVTLMCTAKFESIEFIITIELNANIDKQGLFNFNISKIKIGALNITPIAKLTAKKMYTERIAAIDDIDLSTWRAKIAASLLNDEAFEPVFDTGGQSVKVVKIVTEKGKLTASLIIRK